MTVPATPNIERHAGNGTTGPWAYPYRYLDNNHLKFIYRLANGTEGEYVQGVDYSISAGGPNDPTGCVLTTTSAVAAGVALAIYADTPAEQSTTPDTLRTFREQAFEQALDALAIQNRRVSSDVDRALVRNPLDTGGQFTLNNLTPGYVVTIQDADTLRGDEILADDVANAQGFATSAGASAAAAAISETKADQWANEAEDTPVETGPDQFSAFHWAKKAEQGVASPKVVQADAPGSPTANAQWFQTRTGKSYLWYDDGATTQWVQDDHDKVASVAQGAIVFPAAPTVNDEFTPNPGGVTYLCVATSPAQWNVLPDTALETQVATNTGDIATNAAAITANAGRITTLENEQLGVGQSYTSPTNSDGVWYQNTSGRAKFVMVRTIAAGTSTLELSSDGSTAHTSFVNQLVAGANTWITALWADGDYYRTTQCNEWREFG